MDLETVYYIGQTLAVLALIVSLVFVGFQIRQNTRATQAASHNDISIAFSELNQTWADNHALSEIVMKGMNDRQALNPVEQWRYDATCRAYFHIVHTMFMQARLGVGDKSIMFAEERGLKTVLSTPGGKEFWMENPYGFSEEFRAYIDRLIIEVDAETAQLANRASA